MTNNDRRGGARSVSQEAIKALALVTMTLNHVANALMTPGTMACRVLQAIGYFTAPVMLYFLWEGFTHTRSRAKYLGRLLVFAVLAQFPFSLALTYRGQLPAAALGSPLGLWHSFWGALPAAGAADAAAAAATAGTTSAAGAAAIEWPYLNMLFTLALCLALMWAMDAAGRRSASRWQEESRTYLLLLLAVALSSCFDWAILAPLLAYGFADARGDRTKVRNAFLFAGAVFAAMTFAKERSFGNSTAASLAFALLDILGLAAAAFVILYRYSGQRNQGTRPVSKYFFYVYYPAHLLILGLIAYASAA